MNKYHAAILDDGPKNKDDPAINLDMDRQKTQAVSQSYDWFEKDRVAKQPITAEWDEMYKLFKSDHWNLLDDNGQVLRTPDQKRNHPNAVENLVFSMVEGLVAEFSETKELVDFPQEENDQEAAIIMTQLKEFIAYKNRFDLELIKWLRWFFLYGTGIWEVVWDPNWKGGKGPNRWTGEARWQALHPRCVFPDARCLDDFEDGRRLHKAVYMTLEEVEETWPDAKGVAPDSMSDDIVVPDDLEYTTAESTEDVVLVVTTYYKGRPMITDGDEEEDQGPGLHCIQWAGEGTLKYLSHENYVNFDPGEDISFPIKGYKCYERERSPWGMGEAYQLKNPQIIKNKTAELIIETHIYEAMGQTWFETNTLTPKQKKIVTEKGSLPGQWFEVQNVDGIKREYGRSAPASLENEAARLDRVMEAIVGRHDISQGKVPGSVTAFRALDLLNTRAQVRLRSKDMTIMVAMEDCGNSINRLVSRNYNENRKYRILGKGDAKPTWGVYQSENMKKVYLFATDEVISKGDLEGELLKQEMLGVPPDEQWQEGEDYEIYSPEFDTKCKVTSKMPSDRIFYMEMAKELFAAQLIDLETFYYVIEYGKFPPIEQIMRKMQQGGMFPPGGAGVPQEQQIIEFINFLRQEHPEILKQIEGLPEEQQIQVLSQMMLEVQANGGMPAGGMPGPAGEAAGMVPGETEMPEDQDPAAIKQQLIDIILAQKEQSALTQ